MKIQVAAQMTLGMLQQAFNSCFPFLSLAFFTKPESDFQSNPVKYLITEAQTVLGQLVPQMHQGELEISGDMTARKFEQILENDFGLHVKVMLKLSNFWKENALTQQYSLSALNDLDNALENRAIPSTEYIDARPEWYLG